jgi:predicted metal-dependent peptidase
MNQTIADKLVRARTDLLIDQPFFGALALRLRLIEDMGTQTMSTNGTHIKYNPDFVASLSIGLTRAIVAHEVVHCMLDHVGRCGPRHPRKWNQAIDYVTNELLTKAGFNFEGTGLLDSKYDGMTADQVYDLLPDSEEGDGNDPMDVCEDGDPNTVEVNATDWKIATVQAANAAAAQGKLPDHLKRFIDELLAPKIDWRERLRRFVTQISRDDYSWTRPNRRMLSQGMYLPSLYSHHMGTMVVAIDTSGSIDQHTLTAFGSEISAIHKTARPAELVVIYCDADVNHVDRFGPNDELHFDMHGGGGTDFRPPFAWVSKESIQPACMAYLTDGYGSFPTSADFPVMWVCTTNVVAPFGETVPIEV